MYAKREIGNDPNLEGIFLTGEGDVAEGIVSNVFWRKGDKVLRHLWIREFSTA